MLIGIDEVGRGCLAGPLCVAAVALIDPIEGLKDSKLLSASKREYFDKLIREKATYLKIALIDNNELDQIGLSKALEKAFNLSSKEASNDAEFILDGNINYLKDHKSNSKAIIKADNLYPEVSAASIVAKVHRDKIMDELDVKYPGYNFKTNKGYGTKEHLDALNNLGVTEIHRRSFKPVSEIIKQV